MDSFFIRENGDKCDVRRVLEPYERLGILNFDLAPGPKYPLQTNWYNQCARLAAVKHSWVAFIDVDEFMVVLNKCAPPPLFCISIRQRSSQAARPPCLC